MNQEKITQTFSQEILGTVSIYCWLDEINNHLGAWEKAEAWGQAL